ncbi:hypothetical protein C8R43DRAFT_1175220 [Mycena crocata]|nr:hypothetical protein C8R43DRAFT_1175220 [Mycena crocata]
MSTSRTLNYAPFVPSFSPTSHVCVSAMDDLVCRFASLSLTKSRREDEDDSNDNDTLSPKRVKVAPASRPLRVPYSSLKLIIRSLNRGRTPAPTPAPVPAVPVASLVSPSSDAKDEDAPAPAPSSLLERLSSSPIPMSAKAKGKQRADPLSSRTPLKEITGAAVNIKGKGKTKHFADKGKTTAKKAVDKGKTLGASASTSKSKQDIGEKKKSNVRSSSVVKNGGSALLGSALTDPIYGASIGCRHAAMDHILLETRCLDVVLGSGARICLVLEMLRYCLVSGCRYTRHGRCLLD